jgi:oligoendopeptidase F
MIQRSRVSVVDCWDLSALFNSIEEWEVACTKLESEINEIDSFQGTLGNSDRTLFTYFEKRFEISQRLESISYYAYLKRAEDLGNSIYQGLHARAMHIQTLFSVKTSFENPELLDLSTEVISKYLNSEILKPYKMVLEKTFRYKNHVLSATEEKIMAAYQDVESGPQKIFAALTSADFSFDDMETLLGSEPLTHSSYPVFLLHKDREIRKQAFSKFNKQFESHKNSLAQTFACSVKQDCLRAKLHKFPSAIAASLYRDNVPLSVYEGLIAAVTESLPTLKKYFLLRKRKMGLDQMYTYDLKIPLVSETNKTYKYEDGVTMCLDSLQILGKEYTRTLEEGLRNGWVDKYENKGKQQGAFSASTFKGPPYILLNYQEKSFDSIFTLTHEAGHSMHSMYSKKNNPYQDYKYSIFVAEVASTFNEELLFQHLMKNTTDENFKTYMINKKIDDIMSTIIRQTMFAEFEKLTHAAEEKGDALTLDSMRAIYKSLFEKYFCGVVQATDVNDLEFLRIPHFYNAFYVYKYATGLSAAMSLAMGVLKQPEKNLNPYMQFLSSGGSKFPIDQLELAGVKMQGGEAVKKALSQFSVLVDELEFRLN